MEQLQKINQKATMRSARNEKVYHERNLRPGELVLRKFESRLSKLHPQWDGPFVIHSANSNGSFRLQSPNGHILKFTTNGDRLKRYHGTTSTAMSRSQPALSPETMRQPNEAEDGWQSPEKPQARRLGTPEGMM
jgi:hypothetical protein